MRIRRTFVATLVVTLLHACFSRASLPSGNTFALPTSMPTENRQATPLPAAEPQQKTEATPSAVIPSATALPMPTVQPTGKPLISIEGTAQDTTSLTNAKRESDEILEGVSFSIQTVGQALLSASVASGEAAVFQSNAMDPGQHAYWQKTDKIGITQDPATPSLMLITIPASTSARLLVSGAEKTNIPDTVLLAIPPSAQEELITAQGFDDDTDSDFTTQSVSAQAEPLVLGDKHLAVLIHGAGSEYRGDHFVWGSFERFLQANAITAAEFGKRFILVLFKYDSRKTPEENAAILLNQLQKKYGIRHTILIGHSMGGLIARAAYALAKDSGLYGDIITLATAHNGTPLTIEKLMDAAFAQTPEFTFLRALYVIAKYDLLGSLSTLLPSWPLSDVARRTIGFSNPGLDSLNSFENEFGIPSMTFTARLSFGRFSNIPFKQDLSEWDSYQAPVHATSFFYRDDLVGRIGSRKENDRVLINEIDAIQQLELVTGCADKPHIITYGGYDSGATSLALSTALVEKARKPNGIAQIIKDTSAELQHQFLAWITRSVVPLIPTASGRVRKFFDGLVDLESAFGLVNGPPIEDTSSTEGNVRPNEDAIKSRLPLWSLGHRTMRDYDHLKIAQGDNELHAQLASDIIFVDDRIRAKASYALSGAERSSIIETIRKNVSDPQNTETQGWDSKGSLTQYRSSILFSGDVTITMSKTLSDRASVRFKLFQKEWLHYDSDWSTVVLQQGYQSYSVELSRLGGQWYPRKPGYVKGGFTSQSVRRQITKPAA